MVKMVKVENRKTVVNKKAIRQVQAIMRAQFPDTDENKIFNLPYIIFGRPKGGFHYSLHVALGEKSVQGFIIYYYFSRKNFYYLDYIAVSPGLTGLGIGSALYEFLRTKAKEKKVVGIFFECVIDDPKIIKDQVWLEENKSRLKFFERFGARPFINNRYADKISPERNSTLLVYDPLDKPGFISIRTIQKIVRQILKKKYSDICPQEYIDRVVSSFQDDPVKVREPKYVIK
jgi:GNAT superfamily N-acetyltransferase